MSARDDVRKWMIDTGRQDVLLDAFRDEVLREAAKGKPASDDESVTRNVQCGDCGAYGDVARADDGLLYLFPSGQIGHPRAGGTR
ncbi:hypothetical protein [Streptomyces lydicus]|uniref:hypothetical protein n=1 Tax=Streptomyces lydicus TaxID=47763 RepID=UPI0036E53F43